MTSLSPIPSLEASWRVVDTNHQLAVILAVEKPEECLGRICQPIHKITFPGELAGSEHACQHSGGLLVPILE